jgi:competence protein ComEC
MQKRHILPLFCAGYLFGNAWCLFFGVATLALPFIGVLLLGVISRLRPMVLILLIALLIGFGRWSWWHGTADLAQNFDGESVEIQAVILRQELMSASKQRLLLRVENAPSNWLINQRVQAALPRFPEYRVGQTVKSTCLFEVPVDEDIPYASILRARNVFLLCEEATLEVRQQRPTFLEHPFLWVRLAVLERINRLWPRPHGSLIRGLLLGDRADFPQRVLDDFSASGITHIIALSGFNIAVIFTSLEMLLLRVSLPRATRVWVMIAFMVGFVVLVGAASSIVRAAAMGALAILGRLSGRRPQAMRLLLISAAAMAFANPYVLVYDAGFQLSCLATAGLLTLSDRFNNWCRFVPETLGVRSSLATTLAASAPTLPLLMYQFDRVSVISPVTNMLVLPLIPWIMALGAAATASAFFSFLYPFAKLFAYIAALGCAYILRVSEWFAALPFAATSVSLSPPFFVLLLLLLSFWMAYETHALPSSFYGFADYLRGVFCRIRAGFKRHDS